MTSRGYRHRYVCARCGNVFPWERIMLHEGRPYCQSCIGYVNGEIAEALKEKWAHGYDPRPNQWWPEEK